MCNCICKMGVAFSRSSLLHHYSANCPSLRPRFRVCPPSVPSGRYSIRSRGTTEELPGWRDGGRAAPEVEQSYHGPIVDRRRRELKQLATELEQVAVAAEPPLLLRLTPWSSSSPPCQPLLVRVTPRPAPPAESLRRPPFVVPTSRRSLSSSSLAEQRSCGHGSAPPPLPPPHHHDHLVLTTSPDPMSVAAELEAGGALTVDGTEEVRQRASEVPEPAMDEEDASSPSSSLSNPAPLGEPRRMRVASSRDRRWRELPPFLLERHLAGSLPPLARDEEQRRSLIALGTASASPREATTQVVVRRLPLSCWRRSSFAAQNLSPFCRTRFCR
jgi:hypothetical protein